MINFVQDGKFLTIPAPSGGVVGGRFYVLGTLLAVATATADAGVLVSFATAGVISHAKVSAQAWTLGAAIYWDPVANLLTTTSTDNTLVGPATAVAANPTTTGTVLLRQN